MGDELLSQSRKLNKWGEGGVLIEVGGWTIVWKK